MTSTKRLYCVKVLTDTKTAAALVRAVSIADARKWFVANHLSIARADEAALVEMLERGDGSPRIIADSDERPGEDQLPLELFEEVKS